MEEAARWEEDEEDHIYIYSNQDEDSTSSEISSENEKAEDPTIIEEKNEEVEKCGRQEITVSGKVLLRADWCLILRKRSNAKSKVMETKDPQARSKYKRDLGSSEGNNGKESRELYSNTTDHNNTNLSMPVND